MRRRRISLISENVFVFALFFPQINFAIYLYCLPTYWLSMTFYIFAQYCFYSEKSVVHESNSFSHSIRISIIANGSLKLFGSWATCIRITETLSKNQEMKTIQRTQNIYEIKIAASDYNKIEHVSNVFSENIFVALLACDPLQCIRVSQKIANHLYLLPMEVSFIYFFPNFATVRNRTWNLKMRRFVFATKQSYRYSFYYKCKILFQTQVKLLGKRGFSY